MPLRAILWASGFLLGLCAALATPPELFPGIRPVVLGVVLLGMGGVGEWIAASDQLRTDKADALSPLDAAPADGSIGLTSLEGVRARVNASNERIGRFVRLEKTGDRSSRAAGLGHMRRTPQLRGRIALVSLYLGADGREWSDREITDSHTALTRAGLWVEHQARRWGAPLKLELADTYFATMGDDDGVVLIGFEAEGDRSGPMEENAGAKALLAVTRAARRLGLRDGVTMFEEVSSRLDADAVAWLVHVRRRGRSHAIPATESWSLGLPGGGVAFCYSRESSFPERLVGPARTDAVTIVHELLHLFGATDKYGRSLGSYPRGSVTPRDVMRLSETRLSRLRIDGVTAREIGWESTVIQDETGANGDGSRPRWPLW